MIQRLARSKQMTTYRILKAGFDILDALDTICQIFMFQRCAYSFAFVQKQMNPGR
jgi:hypothetical protein